MKISNLKRVKLAGCMITVLSLLSVAGIFTSENSILRIFYLLFFVIMILIVANLRSIEIENSGECFSLKKRHPFAEKKYVPSQIEIPLSSINEFNIQEGIFLNHMNIKIQNDHSERKLGVSLPLFTRHQILNIKKAFIKKNQNI